MKDIDNHISLRCPKCGSLWTELDVEYYMFETEIYYACLNCGIMWELENRNNIIKPRE